MSQIGKPLKREQVEPMELPQPLRQPEPVKQPELEPSIKE